MNNNDIDLHKKLEAVISLKKKSSGGVWPTEIWAIFHDLAEAKYQPALEFFIEGLDDPAWDWRQRCLQMIGFHYDIPPNNRTTEKVRKMLTSDPDSNVIMTAADVLGVISALPDLALLTALKSDKDWFVRRSAYFALLQLAGVPYEVYVQENNRFDSEIEEPNPTHQDIEKILAEESIEVPPKTFGPVDSEKS